MLGTILRLFRPSYALTALILFGGWQGYTFVKSVPEKLSLPLGMEKIKAAEEIQASEANQPTEQAQSEQVLSSPTVSAIQQISPIMRILSWIVIYVLLCFATVPLIKKILVRESNLSNAVLIIFYIAVGFMLAVGLVAFQFTWITIVMLITALVFSACIIIWLAGELEKIRVQDSFGSV